MSGYYVKLSYAPIDTFQYKNFVIKTRLKNRKNYRSQFLFYPDRLLRCTMIQTTYRQLKIMMRIVYNINRPGLVTYIFP